MLKKEEIPNEMEALVLHEVGKLTLDKVENYKLQKDSVLVKIKYCGICSSDIERVYVTGTYHFPTIPGHEMSGEIVCVNEEDKKILGKRVCIFPMLPCMKCEACLKGEYAQCLKYNYFGSRCDGGFAEYLLVPKWNLVFFDENIDYKVACLAEPSAVSLHAVNIMEAKEENKIAISGTGTIALLIGYFLKDRGCSVTIVGRNKEKLNYIKELGFDTLDVQFLDEYKEKFDGVFEAVGTNKSINQAISLVNTFGKVVLVGNPKDNVVLEKNIYWKILRKQLLITGSWNSTYNDEKNDWKEVVSYMKNKKIPFEQLITREFSLKDSNEAFEFLKDENNLFKFKVVFKID